MSRSAFRVINLREAREQRGLLAPRDHGPQHESLLEVVFDRTVAAVALIALLPLYAVTALLVRISSPGPIIYRQVRIGMNRRHLPAANRPNEFYDVYDRRTLDLPGRPFIIYKFRTMVDGAEDHAGPMWAKKNDSRITTLGKVLRKLRIDETPQFYNVLKGDMSLVGPRPERPTFVRDLVEKIPDYALRLRVKPGITGLAQVDHKYDTSLDDVRTKLDHDLRYLETRGFVTKALILLKTVWVVLTGKGAQ